MKETILLFHMNEHTTAIISRLAEQLDIEVKEIAESDICQTMGYILRVEGYERIEDTPIQLDMSQEFVFFAGMVDGQLDILLDLFKMAEIPFIPYKAMLTEHNIDYSFYQLYGNVAHEYEQISGLKGNQ